MPDSETETECVYETALAALQECDDRIALPPYEGVTPEEKRSRMRLIEFCVDFAERHGGTV